MFKSNLIFRNDLSYPIGIVLSSVSFWRGEWIGLTIIVDIRTILIDIIDPPVRMLNIDKDCPGHLVIGRFKKHICEK